MSLLWVLVVILLILALLGGFTVNHWIFLLLVIVLVMALVGVL